MKKYSVLVQINEDSKIALLIKAENLTVLETKVNNYVKKHYGVEAIYRILIINHRTDYYDCSENVEYAMFNTDKDKEHRYRIYYKNGTYKDVDRVPNWCKFVQ